MTEKEFLKQYGNADVTLQSYYKFQFYFSGTMELNKPRDLQTHIAVVIGGDSDDIYRMDISATKTYKICELDKPILGYFLNRQYFPIEDKNDSK